ncbi:uncharacterized protein LOC114543833 [Dendronephthya gigantea]|nr:uncharacterized protein LOC114541503 isoform X1 [Dendronephthya gigantea]XP_028418464.1 uncharacterized protein LOC114543833 [Dendronephthya gigantea]
MEDIIQLEQDEGVVFTINGQQRSFRGSIGYISGDNLGSQLLGGFKEGSQAYRKCRECMGIDEQIQTKFLESEFELRTKDGYEIHCRHLMQSEHFSVMYGLNRRSVLGKSRYYHVIGGLPADAMHDVLEGTLQYHTKEMLKHFILEEKTFSLDELNKRIASFDYGYHNDSNKPAPILRQKLLSNDNSLKQHANEMWCLGLFLPLLIGEFMTEDDDHWNAYCVLLEIVRIIFSPLISKEQMPYLQVLIQNHHENFRLLYPHASIIPKMHYMIHMPRIMLKLGPLIRIWCMRYEAKHSYFKRLAISCGNFINLPYSLTKRHQEGLCYRINMSEGGHSTFLQKGIDIGPGTETYAGNLGYYDLLCESYEFCDVIPQTSVFEAKWVVIGGTKYKCNAAVHIGYDEHDCPLFWRIHKICIVEKNLMGIQFVVEPMETNIFNSHFQCYEVSLPSADDMKIFKQSEFSCYIPKQICRPYGRRGGTRYICTRYDLGTNS